MGVNTEPQHRVGTNDSPTLHRELLLIKKIFLNFARAY